MHKFKQKIIIKILTNVFSKRFLTYILCLIVRIRAISPLNSLIVYDEVEDHFNKGFFVIVPRLSDNPSEEEIFAWTNTNPKEIQNSRFKF